MTPAEVKTHLHTLLSAALGPDGAEECEELEEVEEAGEPEEDDGDKK